MTSTSNRPPTPLGSRIVELAATGLVSAALSAVVAYFIFRPEVYSHFSCKVYEGTAPFTVKCYDESVYARDVIWDFGDGSASKRGGHGTYTYTSARHEPYIVRLAAIGKGRHESERPIIVRQATALVHPRTVSIEALKASTLEKTTKSCDVSFTNDEHSSTFNESTRDFRQSCDADEGFKISSASFTPVSQTRASVSGPKYSVGSTTVVLTARITAGPRVDQYRGWLHGRIELVQERPSHDTSITLARKLHIDTFGQYELDKSVTADSIASFTLNIGTENPVTLKLGEAYTSADRIRYSLSDKDNKLFLLVQPVP